MGAHALVPCGHAFCAECAHQWLAHKNACPTCRKKTTADPVPVLPLDALVKRLVVPGLEPAKQAAFAEREERWQARRAEMREKAAATRTAPPPPRGPDFMATFVTVAPPRTATRAPPARRGPASRAASSGPRSSSMAACRWGGRETAASNRTPPTCPFPCPPASRVCCRPWPLPPGPCRWAGRAGLLPLCASCSAPAGPGPRPGRGPGQVRRVPRPGVPQRGSGRCGLRGRSGLRGSGRCGLRGSGTARGPQTTRVPLRRGSPARTSSDASLVSPAGGRGAPARGAPARRAMRRVPGTSGEREEGGKKWAES